ncbi:hypothetical protein HYV11_03305 [Candidatus Dependentiae bacterium]|nr:hypothetical protein [Candidatus Dependentiae bacterium]
MVVSSLKNNELIESRGYKSGYGCVYRAKLSKCFCDIIIYEALFATYKSNKEIKRKGCCASEKSYMP